MSEVGESPRTPRGFRVFAHRERPDEERLYATDLAVAVMESSLAFRGAHVRIYEGSEGVQLNVREAHIVRDALDAFITEAEAGMLTEPAYPNEEATGG